MTVSRGTLHTDRAQGVYTNGAVELGVILSSRAFNVWSTVLALILVILWLLESAATLAGVFNGKVLSLDRGWRATYFASNAEREENDYRKEEKDSQRTATGLTDGQALSSRPNIAHGQVSSVGLETLAGLRHRDVG